jgi:hypothetical protein
VSADRHVQLRALLATRDGVADLLCGVCELCVSELDISGARVRVLGGVRVDGGGAVVYATDPVSNRLEDLAMTAGVGPCFDAFDRGHPVLVPELANERGRWPGFTTGALDAGVAAMFAFPLQVGAVRLGVLEMHRDLPGSLSSPRLTDAFLLADTATDIIFDDLHGVAPMTLPGLVDIQSDVHQATGFVAVDLGVSLEEALLRIRGHAFAHQTTLSAIAREILERRLRLENGK